jgi:hypothetical protein
MEQTGKNRKPLRILIALILLACMADFTFAIERPDFLKAVAENKITPIIEGNSLLGSAYGEVVEISIQNETAETIETVLEKGTILESENPDTQDLVVSKDLPLRVGPHEFLDPPVSVFCIEINKNAPSILDFYKKPTRKATGDLLKLVNYIDNMQLHENRAAQIAVWSISDELTKNKTLGFGYGSIEDADLAQRILNDCNIQNSFTSSGNDNIPLYFIGVILYLILVVFILRHLNKTI